MVLSLSLSLFSRYLLNFLLDSTLGLFVIYTLFKIIGIVVDKFKITPLRTGEYGNVTSMEL